MDYILYPGQDQYVTDRLKEAGHRLAFSPAKRMYYLFARPVLPIRVRQWLQKRYGRRIHCRPGFIDDSLVTHLKQQPAWQAFSQNLWPEGKAAALVLTHDVEEQRGHDHIPDILRVEQKYGFTGSWNLVPHKYKIRPDLVQSIRDSGNEIGLHGYNHDGRLYFSKRIFDQRALHINEALAAYHAVGFRSPQAHRNLAWLQQLNIAYDASCFDYDPFQPMPGGTGSLWPFQAGKFIELPYTLPQDHVLFYTLKLKGAQHWIHKAEWIIQQGGMILLPVHPDYLIEKDHLKYYEELLSWLAERKDLYHALPRDIAAHWRAKLSAASPPKTNGPHENESGRLHSSHQPTPAQPNRYR